MAFGEQFDDQSVKRISQGIRRIERLPINRGGSINSASRDSDEPWLWARITGNDVEATLEGGEIIAYDWEKIIPTDDDPTSGLWDSTSVDREATAYEINNVFCPTGTIVRLYGAGYIPDESEEDEEDTSKYKWYFDIAPPIMRGVTSETISTNGVGDVTLMKWVSSSWVEDDIEVEAWFDFVYGEDNIATDTQVFVQYNALSQKWHIIGADCP